MAYRIEFNYSGLRGYSLRKHGPKKPKAHDSGASSAVGIKSVKRKWKRHGNWDSMGISRD